MGRDGTEGGHVGVVEGGVIMLGEGAAELRVAVDYHYCAFNHRDGGEYRPEMLVEAFLNFVMRIEAGVEDEGAMKGEATDRVGASARGCYGARSEGGEETARHGFVGVHDKVGHPFVAKMREVTEVFDEEEAYFGILRRPAIGDLRVMDYGSDHAGALTLDFEGFYYSGLPDRERLFAKLFEMETIVGFHSISN